MKLTFIQYPVMKGIRGIETVLQELLYIYIYIYV